MLLLRHADNTKEQCKNRQLLGRLIYPDETEDISSIYLDQTFLDKFHQTLKILTSPEIPTPQANQWNCRYCTIPDQYCSLKKKAWFSLNNSTTLICLDKLGLFFI